MRQPECGAHGAYSGTGVQHGAAAAADAVGFSTASFNTTASLAKQPVWSQPPPEARAANPWLNASYSVMAPAHALPPPLFQRAQPVAPPSVAAQAFSSSFSLFANAAAPLPLQQVAVPHPAPAPEPMDDDLRYILAQLGM